MPTTIREYFLAIAPIWQNYNDGKISMSLRDIQLSIYRTILPSLRHSNHRG